MDLMSKDPEWLVAMIVMATIEATDALDPICMGFIVRERAFAVPVAL